MNSPSLERVRPLAENQRVKKVNMKSWILLVIGFGVVAAAAVAEKPLRWRAHLLEMKITGEVQDVSWGDLGHLTVRHGVVDPSKIFKTHDLYSAISAPRRDPGESAGGEGSVQSAMQCVPWRGR
jgi:hypothetical protein